ncbi:cysteine hydrolase family protein [Smaragdicoccus niigatensis]|uniref:cysteine hydrolase family protein n=1 Tax=Smaragdicoccus niigatensis TaxID=359359 RepID=UPI000363F5DC|nr:isochorismatase family cysteine hydrolase [Smaragdicoccus niigatensis]
MPDYTEPHWQSAALVIIDVQRDFLDDGVMPVAGTSGVLPELARLVTAFRAASLPICHVVRLYVPGGSDVDLLRRAQIEGGAHIAAPGSAGAELPVELLDVPLDTEALLRGELQQVGPREIIMFKPRWSAFHRTHLQEWLEQNGCDTVVVAGCNLPNCPRATLFDASERDFRAVLATDAVSQVTAERLGDLARIGVKLMAAKDIAAEL